VRPDVVPVSPRFFRLEVLLTNVRFIAQGRRPALVHAPALAAAGRLGRTLGQAPKVADRDVASDLRAALLVLLWQQAGRVDLDTPLSTTPTILDIVGGDHVQQCA
jgi:hypothetical protein